MKTFEDSVSSYLQKVEKRLIYMFNYTQKNLFSHSA